jgi:toxin ParE1/3/4
MTHRVVFTPEARGQLSSIYRYVAEQASVDMASTFVEAIIDYCESFSTFPNRGTRRDDLRSGLRIIGFRRRITIAFSVTARTVAIIGIFYGGQDIDFALKERALARSRSGRK